MAGNKCNKANMYFYHELKADIRCLHRYPETMYNVMELYNNMLEPFSHGTQSAKIIFKKNPQQCLFPEIIVT